MRWYNTADWMPTREEKVEQARQRAERLIRVFAIAGI